MNISRVPVVGSVVALSLATAATAASAATAGPDTELVSVDMNGGPIDKAADRPQISGNGRVITFDTNAKDVTPQSARTTDHSIYWRDIVTGVTKLVTVKTDGTPAVGWSSYSWPSDDGRYVAFTSQAPGQVAGADNRRAAYVRDMVAGKTERISVNNAGKPANGSSSRTMITGDGRYLGFSSFATNLSPVGGNGKEQVYVRDRVAGTTTLVSVNRNGQVGNGNSYRAIVSANGRYVAFSSKATDLDAVNDTANEDVFVRDMVLGKTQRINLRSNGTPGRGGARPYMSPNGTWVVFNSYDALVPADTNGASDVYVVNRITKAVKRVSVSATGGNITGGDSLRGFITDNGRYVYFNSFGSNVTTNDKNGGRGDVFMRDLWNKRNKLLSVSSTGGPANGMSYRPVPDSDGSVVVYQSAARNLVPNDQSIGNQIYAVSPASIP